MIISIIVVPPINSIDDLNFSGIGVEIKLIDPPVVNSPDLIQA